MIKLFSPISFEEDMYAFIYDQEDCLGDVDHKEILMLKPSFNLFLL
jgi:hypothetical protein